MAKQLKKDKDIKAIIEKADKSAYTQFKDCLLYTSGNSMADNSVLIDELVRYGEKNGLVAAEDLSLIHI